MKELALSGKILSSVQQPARCIGGKANMRVKDPKKADIRSVMYFPDVYEIETSHLGIQIPYSMFNNREGTHCECVYSPWTDLDLALRKNKIPLLTLETQEPVENFDFLGTIFQYETYYTNVLQVPDLSQIPLHTCGRTENDSIVTRGGLYAYNSELLADFFDLFYIGEDETVYFELMDCYKENKKAGGTREQSLKKAAEIPGTYVSASCDVTYKRDGTTECFRPGNGHATPVVTKQIVSDMDSAGYIEKPPVPFIKVTQDRMVLEVQRGYIRGCRFCQAGDVCRFLGEYSLEYLKHYVYGVLRSTGHKEILLSSPGSSDYGQLKGPINFFIDELERKGTNIPLPSLRIDTSPPDVMSRVQDVKKNGLISAPEAGPQRLRDVINKRLTEEVIPRGAADAFESRWNRVELCFMLDLPTGAMEDMEGAALPSGEIVEAYYDIPKDQRNGKVQIVASSPFFVPKSFTPSQRIRMCIKEEFVGGTSTVRDKFREMKNFRSPKYNWCEVELITLEGVLARGDRRIGAVIEEVYRTGVVYDSRFEYFKNNAWTRVFEACGVDTGFYTAGERSLGGVFPWNSIDAGVLKELLIREWNHVVKEEVMPNCRQGCSGCGARDFDCGICYKIVKEQDKRKLGLNSEGMEQ